MTDIAPYTTGTPVHSTNFNATIEEIKDFIRAATLPVGYLAGLEASCDASTITISPGMCRDATNTVTIRRSTSAGDLTIDPSGTGAGGIAAADAALANSTWYYVWVIKGDSGVAGFMSTSATPTLPSGYDDYKRRIGWALTDGSATLYAFMTLPGGITERKVMWLENTNTGDFVLSSAIDVSTSPTWDTIDASGVVPATARTALVNAVRSGTSTTYISQRADANHQMRFLDGGQTSEEYAQVLLASDQSFELTSDGAGDEDLYIEVFGFIDALMSEVTF